MGRLFGLLMKDSLNPVFRTLQAQKSERAGTCGGEEGRISPSPSNVDSLAIFSTRFDARMYCCLSQL